MTGSDRTSSCLAPDARLLAGLVCAMCSLGAPKLALSSLPQFPLSGGKHGNLLSDFSSCPKPCTSIDFGSINQPQILISLPINKVNTLRDLKGELGASDCGARTSSGTGTHTNT